MAVEEKKIKLVMLRANFVGESTPERKAQGYFQQIFYDIWIKQEGEKMFVKRADEVVKGSSKIEYESLWHFTEDWTFRYKHIR